MELKLTALVIGNSTYENVDALKNPTNDAEDDSTKLKDLGFEVTTLTNATKEQMVTALEQFGEELKTSSVGLVFFAGHAFQIEGKNYLAPVDTRTTMESSVKFSALDLDYVLDVMKLAASPTNLVILDACRNNPFCRPPAIDCIERVGFSLTRDATEPRRRCYWLAGLRTTSNPPVISTNVESIAFT